MIIDIAAVSIEQARSRYSQSPKFKAFFAAADCYSHSLTSTLPPNSIDNLFPPTAEPFDVVSMQFCMHYAFESEEKARCMLDNASRWLRPGGVLIGTIPNATQLM